MSIIQDKKYKYVWKSNGSEEIYDISDGKKIQHLPINNEIKDSMHSKLFSKIKPMGDVKEKQSLK